MNSYFRFITILVSIFILSQNISFACSILCPTPTKFDSSEYVFIGKVVDVIGPFEDEKKQGGYWGLLVEVKDPIYLPEKPNKYFEIIPFGLGTGCELMPISSRSLHNHFPIGSEVRIVGEKARHICDEVDSGNIRLEIDPFNCFELTFNFPNIKELNSTSSSEYDYSSLRKDDFCNSLREPYKKDLAMYSNSCLLQFDFELRKDLFRLENLHLDVDKAKIINRVMVVYQYSEFVELVNNYIKDPIVRESILGKAQKEWGAEIIHDVVEKGDVDKVKSLLAENPDLINAKNRYNDETPLHHAAKKGNRNIVELLIVKGADVNAKDDAIDTPRSGLEIWGTSICN